MKVARNFVPTNSIEIPDMNFFDITDLPHIVALRKRLDCARTALALPERHARREPLCPRAIDAYDVASREYFTAVDETREGLRKIEASIAAAYTVGNAAS